MLSFFEGLLGLKEERKYCVNEVLERLFEDWEGAGVVRLILNISGIG